jgi:hypothetical protein
MNYRQALEQIATGYITGQEKHYKDTVQVMRSIAKEALETNQKIPAKEVAKIYEKIYAKGYKNQVLALARAIEAKVRGEK